MYTFFVGLYVFEKNGTSVPKALIGLSIFVLCTGLRVFFEIYFITKSYGNDDDHDHKDE